MSQTQTLYVKYMMWTLSATCRIYSRYMQWWGVGGGRWEWEVGGGGGYLLRFRWMCVEWRLLRNEVKNGSLTPLTWLWNALNHNVMAPAGLMSHRTQDTHSMRAGQLLHQQAHHQDQGVLGISNLPATMDSESYSCIPLQELYPILIFSPIPMLLEIRQGHPFTKLALVQCLFLYMSTFIYTAFQSGTGTTSNLDTPGTNMCSPYCSTNASPHGSQCIVQSRLQATLFLNYKYSVTQLPEFQCYSLTLPKAWLISRHPFPPVFDRLQYVFPGTLYEDQQLEVQKAWERSQLRASPGKTMHRHQRVSNLQHRTLWSIPTGPEFCGHCSPVAA